MSVVKFNSFTDILNVKVDEVTPPPLLPAGAYNGVVKQWKESKTRKTEKTTEEFPVAQFVIVPTAPGKDVDSEAFQEYLSLGGVLADEQLTYERVVTSRSLFGLIKFLKESMGAKGEEFGDLLGSTAGADVAFVVKHQKAQKSGNDYVTIDSFYPYGSDINS